MVTQQFLNQSNEPLRTGVSVIIPVYKAQMYLIDAIDSVYEQGLSDDEFEIIVIDDKYPEGDLTSQAQHERSFRELQRRIDTGVYPNLKIINSGENGKNNGQSAARNAGIAEAQFKYVAGLDADDMYVFDPKFNDRRGSYLRRAIDHLEDDKGLVYVSTTLQTFGEEGHGYTLTPLNFPDQWVFSNRERDLIDQVYASNVGVYRTEDACSIGGYDEDAITCEDSHFFARLRAKYVQDGLESKYEILPSAYYLYRELPEGTDRVRSRPHDSNDVKKLLIRDSLPYFHNRYGDDKSVDQIFDLFKDDIKKMFLDMMVKDSRSRRIANHSGSFSDRVGDALHRACICARMLSRHSDSRDFVFAKHLSGHDEALSVLVPDLDEMGLS